MYIYSGLVRATIFLLVVVVLVVVVYARCDAKPLLYMYMYNMYM